MKKQKLDGILPLVSFCVSFVVFGLMMMFLQEGFNDTVGPVIRAIAVGAAFTLPPLAAFLCMHLSASLRRKTKIKLPELSSVLTVVAVLLCFAAGFVGQILYSLRMEEEEIVVQDALSTDIVIMLDDSSSMQDFSGAVRTAAIAFINSMPEENRVATGIFAGAVDKFEDLTYMDSAGKQKVRAVYEGDYRFAGLTDFDLALEKAYDSLMAAAEPDREKAVLLLTDCKGWIRQDIQDKYIANNIKLYTIRVSGSEGNETNDMVKFVEQTGGFDTVIDLSDASSGMDDLLKAFESIPVMVDTEKTISLSGGLLVYDVNITGIGTLIRFAAFLVLTFSVQVLYFRRVSVLAVIGDLVTAAVAASIITFAPMLPNVWIAAAVTAAAIFTAFTMLRLTKEENADV